MYVKCCGRSTLMKIGLLEQEKNGGNARARLCRNATTQVSLFREATCKECGENGYFENHNQANHKAINSSMFQYPQRATAITTWDWRETTEVLQYRRAKRSEGRLYQPSNQKLGTQTQWMPLCWARQQWTWKMKLWLVWPPGTSGYYQEVLITAKNRLAHRGALICMHKSKPWLPERKRSRCKTPDKTGSLGCAKRRLGQSSISLQGERHGKHIWSTTNKWLHTGDGNGELTRHCSGG